MAPLDTLRLIGSGGANRAMEAELKRLAMRGLSDFSLHKPKRTDEQTLVYPFEPELAWLAVSYLRTPSRVLWDLVEVESERLEPLYEELREFLDGGPHLWLRKGMTFSVEVKGVDFPAGPLQVRGTVKNAIVDGTAARRCPMSMDADDPDVLFSVRGEAGALRVSIDLAGGSMHVRGYRLDRSEAPLRENVAAQMLMLARWDSRSEVLLDPMCGSGTIVIEAAAMAVGAPLLRPPARPLCARLPIFTDSDTEPPPLFADTRPLIIGNEIHTSALTAARRNAQRSGLSAHTQFLHGDFRDLSKERIEREAKAGRWPEVSHGLDCGLIIANPPYGERLETGLGKTKDLLELYEHLVEFCDAMGPGWRCAFLSGNPDLERAFAREPAMVKPLYNGNIPSKFLLYGQR